MYRLNSKLCLTTIILLSITMTAGCVRPSISEPESTTPVQQVETPADPLVPALTLMPITEAPLPPSQIQYGNPVEAPVTPPSFLYISEFDYEHIQENTSELLNTEYIQIQGLKDTAVQDKINQKIYESFQEMKERGAPPYRGIRTILADHPAVESIDIYTTVYGSLSNILSVAITRSVWLDNSQNYSDIIPLNFNLHTGDLIPLSDLFADNCNYKEIVNRSVNQYLSANNMNLGDQSLSSDRPGYLGQGMMLVRPFSTIMDNQQYLISFEGRLILIVDYLMPDFDTSFQTCYLDLNINDLDLGSYTALYHRFETWDGSLCEDPNTREKLLRYYNSHEDYLNEYATAADLGLENKITEDSFISLSLALLTDPENETLKSHIEADAAELKDSFNNALSEAALQNPGASIHLNYSYSAQRYGNYLVTIKECYPEINYSAESTILNMDIFHYLTGEPVLLEDLFVPGFQYMELLEQELKHYATYSPLTSAEDLQQIIREAEISLSIDSLNLYCRKEGGEGTQITIPYSEIGFNNLTIFEY